MEIHDRIDQLSNRMTLEHKVGQMLVLGFSGTYPHPDILRMIEQYHVAGFRITPAGRKFVRYLKPGNPGERRVVREPECDERVYGASVGAPAVPARRFAEVLNALRQRSLETGAGIPLYYSLDFEGNQSMDYYAPGMVGFPHPMGLAASCDPTLCRRVARVIGRQLAAVGVNWIHSPCLDVNTEPSNPEINTRSYSPQPEVVSEYARQSLYGFDDAGIIATGKHFPGRGHSSADAHFDTATIAENGGRMRQVHLAPYRALIQAGLPAIMLAHSIFPALDPEREIATLSRAIITDVLRGELGFQGVITTDSFTMGGLVTKYEVVEAAVKCIQAGVDLILLKDENALRGEVYHGLLDAARRGLITEARIEESVRRVLAAKARAGLLDGSQGIVDLDQVEERLLDPEHLQVAQEAAEKSVVVLRAQERVLPIKPGTRVLVVEEVATLMRRLNDAAAYPGALYHALLDAGVDAIFTDLDAGTFEKAWPAIQARAAQVDLVVHSGFFERAGDAGLARHASFLTLGKPTVFVCNSPYPTLVLQDMPTVIVTFSAFAASMQAAAGVLTGRLPGAGLPFDPNRTY